MSSPPTGARAQRRGTMEPPAITPSPRGILRPSGSFKKRQLERLRLEEAEEAEAASVQPRPRVGQRLFAGDDDERPCPWRHPNVDDDAAAREAVEARAASSGRARDRREARERAEPGDENAAGWGSHLKISDDDDPRARGEDGFRVGRDGLNLEAEVREVDALVDALREMCESRGGVTTRRYDEADEVDESDASFRSAEDEPAGDEEEEEEEEESRRGVTTRRYDEDEAAKTCDEATWSPDTVLRPDGLFDESPSPTASSRAVSFDDDGITVHDIGSVKDLRREKRTSIAGVILEWVKADVRGFVEGALTFGRRRKDSAEEAESAKATRKSLRESRRNMYVNVDNAAYGYCGDLGDPDFTFV